MIVLSFPLVLNDSHKVLVEGYIPYNEDEGYIISTTISSQELIYYKCYTLDPRQITGVNNQQPKNKKKLCLQNLLLKHL